MFPNNFRGKIIQDFTVILETAGSSEIYDRLIAMLNHFSADPLRADSALRHAGCDADWCRYRQGQLNYQSRFFNRSDVYQALLPKVKAFAVNMANYFSAVGVADTNQNESFHSVFARLCPKESKHGRYEIDLCKWLAVTRFNDGMERSVQCLLQALKIFKCAHPARFRKFDKRRLENAERRACRGQKKRSKQLRAQRYKARFDRLLREGVLYAPGLCVPGSGGQPRSWLVDHPSSSVVFRSCD